MRDLEEVNISIFAYLEFALVWSIHQKWIGSRIVMTLVSSAMLGKTLEVERGHWTQGFNHYLHICFAKWNAVFTALYSDSCFKFFIRIIASWEHKTTRIIMMKGIGNDSWYHFLNKWQCEAIIWLSRIFYYNEFKIIKSP